MGMKQELHRFLAPLRQKIAVLISRAILVSVDDSTKIQLLKISMFKDEIKDGVERLQPYGLTNVPMAGAEVLVGFIGGRKDQGVAIAVGDSRARITNLSPGDVALHRQASDKVWIKLLDNNVIEINGKNINVNLEAGGQLNVAGGNLTVDK